eukprot:jgi/Chlat1/7166/Chrsp57S06819
MALRVAPMNCAAAVPAGAAGGYKVHGEVSHADWSPYDNNGGTCVAIAGADYVVIAADTRMSTGFSILTRHASKLFQINPGCVIATSGFQADERTLQKRLQTQAVLYKYQHNKEMTCTAMAQLLSNTLYFKRFFPYYTFNLLAGLDAQGRGAVFTYDAIGSYDRVGYSAQGTGQSLIMPVLDNQLKEPSPLLLPAQPALAPLMEMEAVDLIKDCFASACERDIYTGDAVEICIINKAGVRIETQALKLD